MDFNHPPELSSIFALTAFYFGQNVALILHDYGSTLAVLAWLLFFWWFSYSFLLEAKEIGNIRYIVRKKGVSIIKKFLFASLAGSVMVLALAASAFAVEPPIIHFDYCEDYGWVEYIETSRGPKVERSYMSIETGEGLGYKVWRNGELVKNTLGPTCDNDL